MIVCQNLHVCIRIYVTNWNVASLLGHPNLREIWEQYYSDADAVMFVIDSTETLRMPEVRKEVRRPLSLTKNRLAAIVIPTYFHLRCITFRALQLRKIVDSEKLKGRPIIVMANKGDLPFSKPAADIEKSLGSLAQHG